MEKMICVPLGSEFDIKCPTGQPRILISSHYDCPTFIRLSVLHMGFGEQMQGQECSIPKLFSSIFSFASRRYTG